MHCFTMLILLENLICSYLYHGLDRIHTILNVALKFLQVPHDMKLYNKWYTLNLINYGNFVKQYTFTSK